MNTNYAQLPPHIIVKILNLLQLNDFKNAVQACKQWYDVSCCSTIGRRIKIHLTGDINRSYKCIQRPFSKLILTEVNLSRWNYKKFLKKFTYSVRELHIIRCTVTFNKLVRCIKYLTNLESLQIEMDRGTKLILTEGACAQISNQLCNVTVFSIKCGSDQCAGLNIILAKCINLKEVVYRVTNSSHFRPKSKIFENMCNAMAQWPCVNLNSLVLDNESVDVTSFFKNFRRINRATVKILNLLDTSEAYDWIEFNKFCRKLPDLEELEMRSIDDLDLISICESFHKLRLLCTPCFSGRQLGMIGGFQYLEVLNVKAVNENQDQLMNLATSNMPNLKILKLTYIKISREILNALCINFKTLLKLELFLDTYDCSPIFKYLQSLKILHLYFWNTCSEPYDDISTEYTCLDLTDLRYLNITKYVPGLTEELIPKMKSLENFDYFDDFTADDIQNFRYDDQRHSLNLLNTLWKNSV